MRQVGEAVNVAIQENQVEASDWPLNDLASELAWWVDFFNIAFFKDEVVPVPAISFERTKITNLGHYVIGRNSLGIKENINLNRAHLNRPLWDVLATLIHEMAHSWQFMYGSPGKSWFHNKEFQLKMLELGIVINNRGCHIGVTGKFVYMLKRHGISFGEIPDYGLSGGLILPPSKDKPKGKSNLRKWECPCGQSARVGKKEFHATCDLCGKKFTQEG